MPAILSEVGQRVYDAFARRDWRGSGCISRSQLAQVLLAVAGERLSDADVGRVVDLLVPRSEGAVRYEELVQWVFEEDFSPLAGEGDGVPRVTDWTAEDFSPLAREGGGAPRAAGWTAEDAASELRPQASAEEATLADRLAGKGFSVRQLLEFYHENHRKQALGANTLTKDVVRDIVIPETSESSTCYMDSAFMEARGGPRRATKLVSHAWDSRFLNTVLNIVLDASGWSTEELLRMANLHVRAEPSIPKLLLKLQELEGDVCEKTYWLCIFAVNQHTSICGDCFGCRGSDAWSKEQYAAERCAVCDLPKRNPCPCGSQKHRRGDPLYEIDSFGDVVKRMEALVVSLDAEMLTLTRVWVVREVGAALEGVPVRFRLALGMKPHKIEALRSGEPVLPPVRDCQCTSPLDKARILAEIDAMEGGQQAYDDFVNTMVELNFGRCARLAQISGSAAQALTRIPRLEMDFRWCRDSLSDLASLGLGRGVFGALRHLRGICMNFSNCRKLVVAEALEEEFRFLGSLARLDLSFYSCRKLGDVEALGRGLGKLRCLQDLSLCLFDCQALSDLAALGDGIGQLRELRKLHLNLACCPALTDVTPLGKNLAHLGSLRKLHINLHGCTGLTDANPLGQGVDSLHLLEELVLYFNGCSKLSAASALGESLGRLPLLRKLILDFHHCRSLTEVAVLSGGSGPLESLREVNLCFYGCERLAEVSALGRGLGRLSRLEDLNLHFAGCASLEEVTALSAGLGCLRATRTLFLNFRKCTSLSDVTRIGHGLEQLRALRKLNLNLKDCAALDSVEAVGHALGGLPALKSLTVDLCGCTGLASVTALGSGAGLQELEDLTFYFNSCTALEEVVLGGGAAGFPAMRTLVLSFHNCAALQHLGSLGRSLGRMTSLQHLTLYLNGCGRLESVTELCAGLHQLVALRNLTILGVADLPAASGAELRAVACAREAACADADVLVR